MGARLKLNDNPDILGGFVPESLDAFQFLFLHQLRDGHNQVSLVHPVRNGCDDDGVAASALTVVRAEVLHYLRFSAADNPPPAGGVRMEHILVAVSDAAGGGSGALDEQHQVLGGSVFVVNEMQSGGHGFGEIVGRDVGGHTDGDAQGAIEKK